MRTLNISSFPFCFLLLFYFIFTTSIFFLNSQHTNFVLCYELQAIEAAKLEAKIDSVVKLKNKKVKEKEKIKVRIR
jgi:hypothetical protein